MSATLDPLRPPTFPPIWASGWGEDRFGIWAELSVSGVISRYRWIKPGHFTMGSPANEPGRSSDEQQRDITIQHGFWLGDTVCTQALWQAVMAENPSHFKGEDRPIEQVNWHQCVAFCEVINELIPGIVARLPYESEWEYACRAETITAFSFGDSITADQVNYNAHHPYENSPKGNFRNKTLPVKELPANRWGLYQMHGNVWEWCMDATHDPEQEAAPLDEGKNILRVMRGGSWFNWGGIVRSATSYGFHPGKHARDVGFRFVLDPAQKKGKGSAVVREHPQTSKELHLGEGEA